MLECDVQCILDTRLVNEKENLIKDLFEGSSFDIILSLLKKKKTANEVSRDLGLNLMATKLYLARLLKEGIVITSVVERNDNTVETIYELSSSKLDIINRHYKDENSGCKQTIEYLKKTLERSINNVYKFPERPYLVNSCFINIKMCDVEKFREKLEKIVKDFEDDEDNEAQNVYSMCITFTPFEL